MNVRARFVVVNQPVPHAHKRLRIDPSDTIANDFPVFQNHLKYLPLCIASFPLHLETLHTPLYTGAVVRPGRNNGSPCGR